MTDFISDKTYKGVDFTKTRLPKAEYENCVFEGCDFSNGYLDNQNFMECTFLDCNLSNANITHTTFKEVAFDYCKMIGVKFDACNDFLMDFAFNHSALNLSSFVGLSLKNQKFLDCKLIEVDFTEADLSHAKFDSCNLDRAIFFDTNLEASDFTSAVNVTIDPERNQLKKAKFSKENVVGLLTKYGVLIQ